MYQIKYSVSITIIFTGTAFTTGILMFLNDTQL